MFFAAILVFTSTLGPVEVIDGDTIRHEGKSIRVLGLDTPEIRSRCPSEKIAAHGARDRLARLIEGAKKIQIEPSKRPDRYGRVLATITIDGRNVADILIGEGLARPYQGGKRASWC